MVDNALKKVDRLVLFFVIYTLIFFIFFGTIGYTLPFVLAILFAYILQKPTRYLITKCKFKNSWASLLTTFLFFAIIITPLTFGISSIINELIALGKSASDYVTSNSDKFANWYKDIDLYYKNLDPYITSAIESSLASLPAKLSSLAVLVTSKTVTILLNFIMSLPYLMMLVLFTLMSTYFFTKDMSSAKNKILSTFKGSNLSGVIGIFNEGKKMLLNYSLSYLLIIFITFIETLIAFSIFGVKYSLLLSVLCGIFDILPVLGIGTIYIPLAGIYLLSGNYFTSIGLIICYVAVTIIRNIIEPKLVSSTLGLHPVAILAALFIGLKAAGFTGMLYCVFLVVFYNVLKKVDVL